MEMKRAAQSIAVLTMFAFLGMATRVYGQEVVMPDPEAEEIKPADNWVYATVEDAEDKLIDGDVACWQKQGISLTLMPGGILMSEAKAMRAANYKLAFDEVKTLYSIDLKAWPAKLDVYKMQLVASEKMIEKLQKEAKRTWLEKNGFTLGLIVGMIISGGVVGLAVGLGTR